MTLTFNHIALSVKDVDISADFYQTVLRLTEIPNKTGKEGIRWFAMGNGSELHLVSPQTDRVIINKTVHLAFSTADFDKFLASLREIGSVYSDWPGEVNAVSIRADGVRQDPDGYWIEVNDLR